MLCVRLLFQASQTFFSSSETLWEPLTSDCLQLQLSFFNFFPFSCDLLKNKLSKSRACSVRALLLKNAAVPSLETLYRLSGPTKAVSDGEENTSRKPWRQRNPQKKTEPEICCERKKTWAFSPAGGAAALWKHYTVSCSLNMIKAVFSHKKDEIIVKYEKKKPS